MPHKIPICSKYYIYLTSSRDLFKPINFILRLLHNDVFIVHFMIDYFETIEYGGVVTVLGAGKCTSSLSSSNNKSCQGMSCGLHLKSFEKYAFFIF